MNIAFLDVETTGLDPQKHELLEVAFVLRGNAPGALDQGVHFSLAIDERRASEKALEVNHYRERRDELIDAQKGPQDAITTLMLLKGALIVGNNVQFDLRFIEAFLARWMQRAHYEAGLTTTPWYYAPLDLKSFVAGRCGMNKPASTKLIAEVAGVPLPDDAHTALADARWNRDVYGVLTAGHWSTPR